MSRRASLVIAWIVLCIVVVAGAYLGAMALPVGSSPTDERKAPVRTGSDPALETASGPDTVPLMEGLGDHHHGITTDAAAAQAYFDQGLRLQYAFNHAEAVRAYREALRRDPGCAMCWWGIALASGPNINAAMDSAAGREAYEAIGHARDLSGGAAPAERAYIAALARRYAAGPAADRATLDSAYARAMEDLARRFPDDPDALTLFAASLMNLSPWNYWTGEYGEREPRPDTPRILAALERALELQPDHPGACHYYIHAVEAAHPEKAVACADRLAALMPAAGHIVHMPGHIYIRVGRYADAVRANEHAVHADEAYIADRRPTGLYPTAYYPHNYHFMWFAASMAGMSQKAIEAAGIVAPKVPIEVAREIYWVQTVTVLPQLAAVTFGRWEDVLSTPSPPADLPVAVAMHDYARGVALAATGKPDEARAALADVRRAAEELARRGAAPITGSSPAGTLTDIAVHALEGEIALRSGRPDEAVSHLEEAAAIEDALLYEEPPLWYLPIRHALGRALLEAGRPAEAEAAYRKDLARFPANGWSLLGLSLSLEAQGKTDEAARTRLAFREAWKDADVEITASRI
jgi:tetratricopeptide (TPR) repeat protein